MNSKPKPHEPSDKLKCLEKSGPGLQGIEVRCRANSLDFRVWAGVEGWGGALA